MYLTPLQLEAVKKGTLAERPASSTTGTLYYTTDTQELYLYTSQGWILPATPPAVVTSVTPTDSGSGRAFNNGRASISFTQPTTAGVSTSYTAIATPVSGGSTFTGTAALSPVVVTGLLSNTSYTYTITGANSYGQTITTSSASVLSTTVPQAPTSVSGTTANTSSSVSVTAGATGGSAITSFTVTPYIAGVAQTGLIASNSSSPVSVTGLTNGTAYTFTATATNANGASAASSASGSVTPSANQSYSFTFSGMTATSGNGTGYGKHYDMYFNSVAGEGNKVYNSSGAVVHTFSGAYYTYVTPTPDFSSNGGSNPGGGQPNVTHTFNTGSIPALSAGSYMFMDNAGYGGGTVVLAFSVNTDIATSGGNGNCYKVYLT